MMCFPAGGDGLSDLPNPDEGATGPSQLGTGDDSTTIGVSARTQVGAWPTPQLPMMCFPAGGDGLSDLPNPDEGATGPSQLGTGDDSTTIGVWLGRKLARGPLLSCL